MTREQAKCATCRYFDAVDDKQGFCRGNLPTRNREGDGVWPKVFNYEWCGHHRPFFKVVNTPLGVIMKPVEGDDEEE